jgi:2-dehydropantoate 2-reductase
MKTKVAVIGCGGIGGVIAANLTKAGVDVTPVVGNPQMAQKMAARGLRVIELDGTEWSVAPPRAPIVELAESDGPFDLVVVATQNPALERALNSARSHLLANTTIVTCQNGLPEPRAIRLLGERVVGCVVGWGASMVEPAVYQRTSRGSLQLGRASANGPDPAPVAELLSAASPTVVVDDFTGVRWSKLAINCVTTTLGAVGGVPLGRLLAHRPIRRLGLELFAEVAEVAKKEGVRLQPIGGTLDIDKIAITEAERQLAFGSPSLAYKHSLLLAVGLKYRRMRSSMLYALERGRPPEIDYLNGEIVRRAEAHGITVPVNAALVAEVRAIEAKAATPSLDRLRGLYDQLMARARMAA